MGCGSSCGTSGGGCSSSGSCGSKMDVYDWLSNMSIPEDQKYKIVEVRFKGGRKGYFRNEEQLDLSTGDKVVIETDPGHHIGEVTLQGELVRLQVRKRKITNIEELPVVYRLATDRDIEKLAISQEKEMPTLFKAREIIKDLKLAMKLSDLEYQADATKATFFYSADERVDFRELIKRLAGEFRVRVEMRQISLRQEAGRLGGIGSCGRELCCSTWLTDFKSVATSAARYQNLSLNPSKLSGQCGRLKCCLNYELETYLTELESIPEVISLKIEKGEAFLQKTDIFKKMMWFSFQNDNNWHQVSVERVNEIIALNKKNVFPHSLEIDEYKVVEEQQPMNNDLLQLDKRLANRKGEKKNNSRNNKNKKNFSERKQNFTNKKQENQGQGGAKENSNVANRNKKTTRHKKVNNPSVNKQVTDNKNVEAKKTNVVNPNNTNPKKNIVKRKSVTPNTSQEKSTPVIVNKRRNIVKNDKK